MASPMVIAMGEPLIEFSAETPGRLGEVKAFRRGWGGDTSNFSIAVARLGGSAGYVTRVGADEFGRAFRELWDSEGVDSSQVKVDPEAQTGIYLISRQEHGHHEFTYYRKGSAASRLMPDDVDDSYLADAGALHVTGISQAISVSAGSAVSRAIEVAQGHGLTVSYDANVRPALDTLSRLRDNFVKAAALADIVFVSRDDLSHLGLADGAAVVDLGASVVVVMSGADGCRVVTEDGSTDIEGGEVDSIDATGAGDAFAAGFVVEWLNGADPVAAAEFANVVGGLTTRGLGAVEPIPTRADVEQVLRRGFGVRGLEPRTGGPTGPRGSTLE